MDLSIESWSPEYGTPIETGDVQAESDQVDVGAEVPAGDWAPLDAGDFAADCVNFVDGVRRIEARIWITGSDSVARLGICASYAAGRIRCHNRATIASVRVGRGFFGMAGTPDLNTPTGTFAACPTATDHIEVLVNGLQERMSRLEAQVAGDRTGADPVQDEPGNSVGNEVLTVVDGPLRGRRRIPGAIGYIKSHHVQYLPGEVRPVVAALDPRQRTPVFLIQTTWTRYSWYMRLARASGHPWAGIVRMEAWPDVGLDRVRHLANSACATLPRFASETHRDDRAPQNLYPIAGLEKQLRHRLGDPEIVYRGLQRAVFHHRSG